MQSNPPPSKNALMFGSGAILAIIGYLLAVEFGLALGLVAGLTIGERYFLYKKSQSEMLNRIEKLEDRLEEIDDPD